MSPRFGLGAPVRIRLAYPPGHVRTPYYLRGKTGEVIRSLGNSPNPEELAYGRDGEPALPLYWVKFMQTELWGDYTGEAKDTAVVEVLENWLEPLEEGNNGDGR